MQLSRPLLILACASSLVSVRAEFAPFRSKAADLVAQMTLEEKASLASGATSWTTKPIERLGVPAITLTDGPHGVRMARPGAGLGLNNALPATCFPTAPALAATWNVDLLREVGVALGREAQTHGVQILLGPGANLKRSPLAGRNFEYFSEDPLLSGTLAGAWIDGVQSQGVGTSLKHFAANNQEFERMKSDSIVGPRALHELYLRSFEIAVRQGRPWTLMASYNRVNGTYASENEYLLTRILRQQWGHDGFVVSDWGAVNDRVAALRAGLHLEMPASGGFNDRKLVAAVQAGELDEAVLDAVITDLLAVILRAHAAIQPGTTFDADAHHAFARKVGGEGIVLLRNEADTLPLNPSQRDRRIALIGEFAKLPRYQGAGSSQVNPTRLDNAHDELIPLLAGQAQVSYAAGYDSEGNTTSALLDEAVKLARESDHAIVFVGLPDSYESEGFDRTHIGLPADHNRLVAAVAAVAPRTTVVLMNGSPVTLPWVSQVGAIVEAYLGGQAGGGAIADVLTGRVNPSGRLAETFPARIEDTPTYLNFPGHDGFALYGEGTFAGYRHYDAKKIEPLFPFGFGLSYTTFRLSNLKVGASRFAADAGATLQVTVENTGRRAGAEVVQVYVRENVPAVPRPERELKAFAKVFLQPGESRTVTLSLDRRAFEQYDPANETWLVRSGAYTVFAGTSSRDLPLQAVVEVDGGPAPTPKITRKSTFGDLERHPRGKPIFDGFIAQVLGSQPKLEDMNLSPQDYAAAKKARETMIIFLREITLEKMVMMSQGAFTEDALQGILAAVGAEPDATRK